MNAEITVHPKLQHYGLVTANLAVMTHWYRTVLGMTVNHRLARTSGAQKGLPFSAAFVSNDEVHHPIVFLRCPGSLPIPTDRATGGCSTSLSNTNRSTTCWAPTSG